MSKKQIKLNIKDKNMLTIIYTIKNNIEKG